jgi:ketosteroid isomerase-like protein
MSTKPDLSKSKVLVRKSDGELPIPGGQHTPQEVKNLELVALFYEYHENKRDEDLLGLLTDDCVYVIGAGASEGTVPYHGLYRGKDQIAAYLEKKRSFTVRPFCGFRTNSLVDGPFVVCIGVVEDEFRTSRYRVHRCPFLQFFVVDEELNKISRMEYFVDTAATAAAWQRVIQSGTAADKA